MGVQHDGRLWSLRSGVIQMQVVVGNAAVPIRPCRRLRDVMYRLQQERYGATGLQRAHEVVWRQRALQGRIVLITKGQRSPLR